MLDLDYIFIHPALLFTHLFLLEKYLLKIYYRNLKDRPLAVKF